MLNRLHLLIWCVAAGLLAIACFQFWHQRNSPLYQRFESQWRQDIALLEESGKLRPAWFEIREIQIVGGTPETRAWLERISPPIRSKGAEGHFDLEVLTIAWEEAGVYGVTLQYTFTDIKTKNSVWEFGRTLILSRPSATKWTTLFGSLSP